MIKIKERKQSHNNDEDQDNARRCHGEEGLCLMNLFELNMENY